MALDLNQIDVFEFLSELGMNNVREENKDVWYSCFSDYHHRGDANPSASMEKGTTRFYCFSCGMKGNAISFLAELENVSPLQASIWIQDRFGGGGKVDQETLVDQVKEKLNKKPDLRIIEKPPVLSELEVSRRTVDWQDILLKYKSGDKYLENLPGETWQDMFQERDTNNPLFYMIDRGFDIETLTKWNIGWDIISQRITIPIRDVDGNLIGFKGRTTKPEERNRYLVLGGPEYGFEPYTTKQVIFALDKAIRGERFEIENRRIILCEGELNALAMQMHGFDNAVGISGKILSDEQSDLLKQFAKEVVLIFDEEEDAINAAKKLRTRIPTSIIGGHDKDPAEMTRQELYALLGTRKSSLLSSI